MPRAVNGRKICSKCRIEKDVSDFTKLLKSEDGYCYSCKACEKLHSDSRRERIREVSKKSYAENRDERIAHSKKYRLLKNGLEIPESVLKFLSPRKKPPPKNEVREKERARLREYKASHKDLISLKNKEYLQTERGKELSRLKTQRYRARKNDLPYDLSEEDISFLLDFQERKCGCCQRPFSHEFRYEIDHVVPVTSRGAFTLSNTQLLCRSCNASKRDKTIRYIPLILPENLQLGV